MTPAEAYERCLREVDPDREYTVDAAAPLLGVDRGNVSRWCLWNELPSYRERAPGKSGPAAYRILGADVLAMARYRAAQVRPHPGVIAMARSHNAKLGGCAVTIVARQSCPTTCAFHRNGCYAEHDNNRVQWDRITAGAVEKTPLELARDEAEAIDGLPGTRDLRLHVAGDSVTEEGTRLIAAACDRYVERGRVPLVPHGRGRPAASAPTRPPRVFAYTHGWRQVPRKAWGRVSILASCETAGDVREANGRGYAAALVVPEFAGDSAHPLDGADGVKVLPCPQQTRERTCVACRLCMDAPRLLARRLVIGFALHGCGSRKAAAALRRVALPMVA